MDIKAKLDEAKVSGVADIYKKINPNATELEMLGDIRGYSTLLQASKAQRGRAFTARSLDDMLKNKHKNNDALFDLAENGNLDAC